MVFECEVNRLQMTLVQACIHDAIANCMQSMGSCMCMHTICIAFETRYTVHHSTSQWRIQLGAQGAQAPP